MPSVLPVISAVDKAVEDRIVVKEKNAANEKTRTEICMRVNVWRSETAEEKIGFLPFQSIPKLSLKV